MCTYVTEKAKINGSGKGQKGQKDMPNRRKDRHLYFEVPCYRPAKIVLSGGSASFYGSAFCITPPIAMSKRS